MGQITVSHHFLHPSGPFSWIVAVVNFISRRSLLLNSGPVLTHQTALPLSPDYQDAHNTAGWKRPSKPSTTEKWTGNQTLGRQPHAA